MSRSALLPQPTSNESLPSEAFDSDVARRARLIKIYLAERRYRLKTCKYLVITALCTVGDGKGASSGRFSSTPKWVDSIGNDILSAWDIKGVSQYGGRNIFLSGIDSLRARIRGLEEGSNLFRDQGVQESVEAAWCENQIIEIVAILETMLVMLGNLTQMSRSGVVSSWFRLMSDYGFFEIFEPVRLTIPDLGMKLTICSHSEDCMIFANYSFSHSRHSFPSPYLGYRMLCMASSHFQLQRLLKESLRVAHRTCSTQTPAAKFQKS